MTDKTYDILNRIQRWLPGLGIFYMTIAGIWGLPLADAIDDTILAVATFLAFTLEVATAVYYKNE